MRSRRRPRFAVVPSGLRPAARLSAGVGAQRSLSRISRHYAFSVEGIPGTRPAADHSASRVAYDGGVPQLRWWRERHISCGSATALVSGLSLLLSCALVASFLDRPHRCGLRRYSYRRCRYCVGRPLRCLMAQVSVVSVKSTPSPNHAIDRSAPTASQLGSRRALRDSARSLRTLYVVCLESAERLAEHDRGKSLPSYLALQILRRSGPGKTVRLSTVPVSLRPTATPVR